MDEDATGFPTIKTSRDRQALLTYFAPTVVPVFKARYEMANRDAVIAHFDGMRADGAPSLKTNLSCWHSEFDLHELYPDLLGAFATDMIRICNQCLNSDRRQDAPVPQIELWYADYHEGGFAREHAHGYTVLSFVYYLETAAGASGLVFHENGLEIGQPIERSRTHVPVSTGDLLMFPGFLKHSVPPTAGTRKILAGNIFDPGN